LRETPHHQVAPGEGMARQELKTLGLICSAHCVSHFHYLVIVPLFPLLHRKLGVDYVQLGLAITIFNVVSALVQAPMGWLVDHFGPRRILLAGLCLSGVAFSSLAAFPSYNWLLPAAGIAGLANSVYHPSDYAILGAVIEPARVGRAFSFHTFAGYLGSAIAPPVILLTSTRYGLSGAFLLAGLIGPIVAVPLAFARKLDSLAAHRPTPGTPQIPVTALLTPTILSLTAFFALLSLSTGAITNFSVVALKSLYATPLTIANGALSAFLCATAIGVLAGGLIADRTRRHNQVAAACFAATAVLTFTIGTVPLAAITLVFAMTAAGFLSGMIAPSRDMMVRAAAPPGASGRVFGIVTTGFNIGGMASPMLGGWIMDQAAPRWVFYASVLFMLITVIMALATERRHQPAPAPVPG
jgi:MFS transporter, FSR family, fosmidomycin resistance protein